MAEPSNDKTGTSNYYRDSGALEKLPDEVQRELQAHLDQYLRDPEKAHLWDPVIIGVPGGPVKTLLLTCVGRKSGRTLHTVLQYYKLDGKIAIVASRGGTTDHPSWYQNLLAQPRCTVQIAKASSPATPRTVHGEERARWWASITKEQPIQLIYQARTERVIPVVVLDFERPEDVMASSV
ncbi:MAG: nitroreductase/quinone reductase family protein [Acidobacteriaceae bacterium]